MADGEPVFWSAEDQLPVPKVWTMASRQQESEGDKVPYDRVEDINERVRKILPLEAQEIFMKAYNSTWANDYPEPICFARAWRAVKAAGYRKSQSTGRWTK